MSAIARRVRILEEKTGQQNDEKGARALVKFGLEFGLLAPDVDSEDLVQECVRQGLSLAKILDAIDGMSRGYENIRRQLGARDFEFEPPTQVEN